MTISLPQHEYGLDVSYEAELLIKESRRKGRWRLFKRSLLLIIVGIVIAVVATFVQRGPTVPGRDTNREPGKTTGTKLLHASVKTLATVDMLNLQFGYAVGGTGQKESRAYLLATSDGGATWSSRSELSFELPSAAWSAPHLDFVSKQVGYVDANVAGGPASNQGVYVTTNGGVSWRRLLVAGYTPTFATSTISDPPVNESYQISGGVLTLVTLRCSQHELNSEGGNWCPSYLDEFRVGAVRPFRVEPIPSRHALPDRTAQLESVRLIAATGPLSAIVALGDMEGNFPVLQTSNGGSTWSTWSNPCYRLRGSTGLRIQIAIQDLRITNTGWYLTCFQGGGMSQGTLYLGRSSNHGRSWRLLSQGSEGATAGNIPFVGNIGDTDVEMWVSNDGSILWYWDRVNTGRLGYSTDGGRQWASISTPRSPLPSSLSELSFDPVGAHGAIAIFPKGVEYSTSNGRTWFRVAAITRHRSSATQSR
jgi:photosystem II stability/assembly factor-like uncharacterized protein